MRKSSYRVKTTYFLVTTSGNLRKMNPLIVGTLAALVLAVLVYVGGKCTTYNQKLIAERNQIQSELTRMEFRHEQIVQDLAVCTDNKDKIAALLDFNAESENTSNEK